MSINYKYPQTDINTRKLSMIITSQLLEDITDFHIQIAASKNTRVTLNPPNTTILNSSNSIIQDFTIHTSENFQNLEPKIKIRITYKSLDGLFHEIIKATSFPSTLTQT